MSVFPHRLFANKTCYGKLLSDDWARGLYYKKYNPLFWSLWLKWVKPRFGAMLIKKDKLEIDYEDW